MTTPKGIASAIGWSFVIAGLPPLALALGWLSVPLNAPPVPMWAAGFGGAALVCAGFALSMPASLARVSGFLAALSISALAALFTCIALAGQISGWRLTIDSLMHALTLRQNAALDVVVLFAVLLDLLAVWIWLRWSRHLVERNPGTPPKNAGPKRKARERIV